jgi:hypothetical protein
MNPSKTTFISLSLCLGALAFGCGASVAPGTDSGADRISSDAVVSLPDVATQPDTGTVGECALGTPARVLMPQVLFAGQPLGLTVEVEGAGCGCALSLRPNGLSSARGFDPTLCNCCRDCECVDSGYRASELLGAPPAGRSDYAITGEMQRRSVHVFASADACSSTGIDVREVTVRGPAEFQRPTGPNLYWVEVTGLHRPCCSNEVGFVNQMQGNAFSLSPRSCETLACDRACPPEAQRMPVQFTATHLLGDLRPGDYRVTVGASTVAFTVR